jgi:multidrug efflux pump subunit AcrA (membrane-fusion protein)
MNRQIAILLISMLFIACGNKQEKSETVTTELMPSHIVGIGKVVPYGGVVNLAAPTSGIVNEIYLNAGDTVKKGDLILTLNSTDEELSVNEANTRIRSQELSVESAQIALAQERIAHKEQQRLLNDAKELLEVGATTGENVRLLQNEFNKGDERLKKVENDLRLQQSQLNELNTQRASKANDFEKTKFYAPIDGILLELVPKVGEALNLHQQYGRISPNKPLVVLVEIDELFADYLILGQTCIIKLPSSTDIAAIGEIIRISPDLKKKSLFSDGGTDLEDRRIREIEVSLNRTNKTLFIESKVECSVQLN